MLIILCMKYFEKVQTCINITHTHALTLTLPKPGTGGGEKWECHWDDLVRFGLLSGDWKERSLSSVEYGVSFSF